MTQPSLSPFITNLYKLSDTDDRAALARLRRGLGHEQGVPEMYRYVVPFLPGNEYEDRWYFLVASLFGLNNLPSRSSESFGKTFLRLDPKRETESTAKRFQTLLNAHEDDIGNHLRQAVCLLKSKEIGVDFEMLLHHLKHWGHPEKWVQFRWAKDFWSPSTEADSDSAEPVSTSPEPVTI